MKTLYYIMILVICLAPIAYNQVDTLEAIEVGTVQAPDNITQLYVQDLNGDSLKELILCTYNHVYAYNQGDSIPFWTSPELVRPSDLQFADINGDSLLDVSVKDSLNIFLFDIYASALIFTTTTNNLYCCYTIGDANGDGAGDLAIVRQEPFEAGSREDSVWVTIYYGPDFNSNSSFSITMQNRYTSDSSHSWRDEEKAAHILIVSLGSNQAPEPRIIILSSYHREVANFHWGTYYYYFGRLWVMNPLGFATIYSTDFGSNEQLETFESNGTTNLYSVMYYKMHTLRGGYPNQYYHKWLVGCYGANQLMDTTRIMYDHADTVIVGWISAGTFSLGELDSGHQGPELCFAYKDSLKEYSLQSRSILWRTGRPADSLFVSGIYNSPLLPSPEILIREVLPTPQYQFVSGITHQINTILPNAIPSISNISDLNHDGNDEILSISGNTLHIYNLEWATPVAERPILPSEYLTVSNYPNPFNAQTIIKYNLPNQCDIALEIYDILGRKIESIEKPNHPAGLGQITWDASSEPSGVYFYRLSAGSEHKTGRMVLLK